MNCVVLTVHSESKLPYILETEDQLDTLINWGIPGTKFILLFATD